jgi:hypothetical protein
MFAPSCEIRTGRIDFSFGAFFDAIQLVLPEAFEGGGPLM